MVAGFDVIITTCNRPSRVKQLVTHLWQLLRTGRLRGRVIVVDSSERVSSFPEEFGTNVLVLKSPHRNQPFQRYLGLAASRAEYVLFLDDDMEIVDESFCEKLEGLLQPGVVGINLKFRNENRFLSELERTILPKNGFISLLRWLSGYPQLEPNRFGLAGNRGVRSDDAPIEFFSGGSFLARRDKMFTGISSQLFDIYQKGLGKGEDAIIGFGLSRQGIIRAHGETFFFHNDQGNSVYTSSIFKFNRRVAYSRLLLSFEYCRLARKPKLLGFVHYLWYSIGRIAGTLLNLLVNPRKSKLAGATGYISGVVRATFELGPIYLLNIEDRNRAYWDREVSSALCSVS
jgi:glycosyltransferase involved in cell wall biosynthesis